MTLLTLTLLPTLKKISRDIGWPLCLTFTLAETHMFTKFVEQSTENLIKQLNKKNMYKDTMDRYCVTKLLNMFWARELASRTPHSEVINIGRSIKEGASLALNTLFIQGRESHDKYMSERKIKPPSDLVTSEKGTNLQKKMWAETEDILKRYAPATATGELSDIFQV